MRDAAGLAGPGSSWEGMERMDAVLHDLCQPLTTLRCRLELAGMVGTPEAYSDAVTRGVAECERLAKAVDSMREIVRLALCAAETDAVAEETRGEQ